MLLFRLYISSSFSSRPGELGSLDGLSSIYTINFNTMAKSRFEYVKKFEQDPEILPCTWIVVRIDGQAFTRFCQVHQLEKPNDVQCLMTMNRAAKEVCLKFNEIVLAYGQSDEYSFVIPPKSNFFNRRSLKITSTIGSYFTSCFVMYWNCNLALQYPPAFDARTVCYPNFEVLLDYLRWRQADCHVNNLYNTVFWAIVKSAGSEKDAHMRLKGTSSAQKNQILFEEFGINYNSLHEMFRKGTVLCKPKFEEMHVDIFHKEFYLTNNIIDE